MPEIRVWEPGWQDRRWTKGLKKLQHDQRDRLKQVLKELVESLASCKHPLLDPVMQRWGPTKWHAPGKQKQLGDWYEYRLGDRKNAARVIVCHDPTEQVIYLVARTAVHDLGRIERIVSSF